MTGGGACDLGRLTRPPTIASARTEVGERMQIALTETITRKRIRQFSNRYRERKALSSLPAIPSSRANSICQKAFIADDSHFFQRTPNTVRQKIEADASECRCIFSKIGRASCRERV